MADQRQAVQAFAALGQEHRLGIVRTLVTAGPGGVSAGALADAVGVSATNLSFHVKELSHAGLVKSRREGRSILYTADFPALSGLIAFLMRDCCQGHPEVCAPAIDALACLCEPTREVDHV